MTSCAEHVVPLTEPPKKKSMRRLSSQMRLVSSLVVFILLWGITSASIPSFWRQWTVLLWGGWPSGGDNDNGPSHDRSTTRTIYRNERNSISNSTTRSNASETVRDGSNQSEVNHAARTSDEVVVFAEPAALDDTAVFEATISDNNTEATDWTRSMERERRLFLDRIAKISSLWMKWERDAKVTATNFNEELPQQPADLGEITPQSDLSLPGRHFHIVTTAALPWFTGTAVNPLLRAAYLHRRTQQINAAAAVNASSEGVLGNNTSTTNTTRWVALVIPWLELPGDQKAIYGQIFATPQEQEDYIRTWLREQADMPDVASPDTGLHILFYPARYHAGLHSIFAMGDLISRMEASAVMDVCVLEEPEHLNWFRAPGDGWTQRFNFVVGILHTNYREYASTQYNGLWTAPAVSMISSAMIRAYCHKVIKLSAVLQTYAPEKESISNVHGVRSEFLNEGRRRAALRHVDAFETEGNSSNMEDTHVDGGIGTASTDVYFIGKLLWAKGLDILLELEDYYRQCTGSYFPIDIYGSGPDQAAIQRAFHGRRKTTQQDRQSPSRSNFFKTALALVGGTGSPNDGKKRNGNGNDNEATIDFEEMAASIDLLASLESLQSKAKAKIAMLREKIESVDLPKTFAELRRKPIPAAFPGRVDHASLKRYKVFVNPSVTEVLCTTTAEALAMGKFAIIPVHPSNTFFMKFPNCLGYRDKFEFVANLRWALTHEPEPLTPELARHFTWEAATDRFIEASSITVGEALERERLGLTKLDERIAWFHNEIGKGATGDMLRKICGAGPVSDQVKYAQEQASCESLSEEDDADDGDEDEEGWSRKFRKSSFAEAIRATVADMSSFIQ